MTYEQIGLSHHVVHVLYLLQVKQWITTWGFPYFFVLLIYPQVPSWSTYFQNKKKTFVTQYHLSNTRYVT